MSIASPGELDHLTKLLTTAPFILQAAPKIGLE
jgi:hypothetical protein